MIDKEFVSQKPPHLSQVISPTLLKVSLDFLKHQEQSSLQWKDKEGVFLGMCSALLSATTYEDFQSVQNAWIKILGVKVPPAGTSLTEEKIN